jgi:hypothetical protein
MIFFSKIKNKKKSKENRRWEIWSAPTFLDPTKKPERRIPYTAADSILLRASLTITNTKEDKGSPCLKPQELLNSPKQKSALKKYNALSNYTISPQIHTSFVSIIRTCS